VTRFNIFDLHKLIAVWSFAKGLRATQAEFHARFIE
jgi:hypothetical protein